MEPINRSSLKTKSVASANGHYSPLLGIPCDLVEKVLGYLPWRERISVVKAIHSWENALYSSVTWNTVSLNVSLNHTTIPEDEWCFKKFGSYIQRVEVIIANVQVRYADIMKVFALVWNNCIHLKHVSCNIVGFTQFDAILDNLLFLILKTTVRSIKISYVNTWALIQNPDIQKMVTTLGISYTKLEYIPDRHQFVKMDFYKNLAVLNCPIYYLSTRVILDLGRNSLKQLRVCNDDVCVDLEFNECEHIDWTAIAKHCPNLCVHYTFMSRTLCSADFPPNALIRSLTINSLCVPLDEDLMATITDLYGPYVERFIHTDSSDFCNGYAGDIQTLFTNFVKHCKQLRCLAIGLDIPPGVAVEIVKQRQLFELWILQEEGEFSDIERKVSEVVGYDWKFLSFSDFFRKIDKMLHHPYN